MEFLERPDAQLIIGVAAAAVAVGVTAYFYFSSKKSKVCLNPEEFRTFKLVKRTHLAIVWRDSDLNFQRPLLCWDYPLDNILVAGSEKVLNLVSKLEEKDKAITTFMLSPEQFAEVKRNEVEQGSEKQ
ncbi:uncharacterized protein LOC125858971 [Solanum stenotomum]|uniref:uncharacterized protein LOC125858971 n=1 Tax=Solanum stenotomum TaxID=172797 RepID=UPI0020D18F90|nr:uncharacterized protein LOC125858971 [Solanum stenotomum]